jgi:CO/xanthine dehydrogenase FAD-binding subunit
MKQFDLYEPTSVSEATGLLNQFGASAKVVAGGSDLLGGIMKDWVTGKGMPYPAQIIDLTTIKELSGIKSGADGIHIGANTTLTELVENQDLTTKVPLLTHAALTVASPLIRFSRPLRYC